MNRYAVATIKPWNIAAFHRHTGDLPGEWTLIDQHDQLTSEHLLSLDPRYVFFPHWSWIVPDAILERWECVCFHMSDVPYGRGGSPLQNLISRGHAETKLTALRMTGEVDAGPVYLKLPLSLTGKAQDIYERSADLVYDAIRQIVADEPAPAPQVGDVTKFARRQPGDSRLPVDVADIDSLYDHIRMLDADTYPPAFLEAGRLRIEFHDVARTGTGLTARAVLQIGSTVAKGSE